MNRPDRPDEMPDSPFHGVGVQAVAIPMSLTRPHVQRVRGQTPIGLCRVLCTDVATTEFRVFATKLETRSKADSQGEPPETEVPRPDQSALRGIGAQILSVGRYDSATEEEIKTKPRKEIANDQIRAVAGLLGKIPREVPRLPADHLEDLGGRTISSR